jgi:hypothetical protein
MNKNFVIRFIAMIFFCVSTFAVSNESAYAANPECKNIKCTGKDSVKSKCQVSKVKAPDKTISKAPQQSNLGHGAIFIKI